jgi:hypothetical protein
VNETEQLIRILVCIASSTSSFFHNDEQHLEQEAANKHLEQMSTDDARLDLKAQVRSFANYFHKKCLNKNIELELLIQEYSAFRETMKKRFLNNTVYHGKYQYSMIFIDHC